MQHFPAILLTAQHVGNSLVHSLRGDIDRAFGAIRQALTLGFRDFGLLRTDPDFENMMAAGTVRGFIEEEESRLRGGS